MNRISGATRYSTALAVATSAAAGTMDDGLDGACSAVKTALVVSGENFPDALAAGTLASNGVNTGVCGNGDGIPLVLTTPGALSPEAAEAINTMGATQVIIVGGTQAVSSATANAIDALAGVTNVERIAGATRTETATDFATMLGTPNGGNYGNRRVFVASGANFPDALVAGPLGGLRFADHPVQRRRSPRRRRCQLHRGHHHGERGHPPGWDRGPQRNGPEPDGRRVPGPELAPPLPSGRTQTP